MTNHAMLAAIAADPDDDTRRLAYADWLDENGDAADRDRAELIRVQCELAKHPGANCGDMYCSVRSPQGLCDDCSRYYLLRRQEAKLNDAHPEWTQWPCDECLGDGLSLVFAIDAPVRLSCPACDGAGDLLRDRHITWDRGWPGWVHVERVSDLVAYRMIPVEPAEEERQGGIEEMWEQKPMPTPLLTALAETPPWGVPLRGVIVDELRPEKGIDGWWIWRGEHESHGLRSAVFNYLPDKPQIHSLNGAWYPTQQAAICAAGAAFLEFGRSGK